VTSLGDNAFYGCAGLTSASIPISVNSIGDNAFRACSALTLAAFLGNAPSMGSHVFDACSSGFELSYLKGKTGFTSPTWMGYPAVAVIPSAPEIVVEQPVGNSLVDGIAKKNFGKAKIGETETKTFKIKNTGTATLSGLAITKTGIRKSNFIVSAPLKTSLAPGAATIFKVTFKPRARGTRKATIHIKSNDANETPFDIKLVGVGVAR
ncbi:MAG TPA: choice-of-anchor D domain-containing protein, partial [Luteolibacter sp.]